MIEKNFFGFRGRCSRTDFILISDIELVLNGYGIFSRSINRSGLQCSLKSAFTKPSIFLLPQPRFSFTLGLLSLFDSSSLAALSCEESISSY